ncbi:MAG: DNA photolyase, partial [Pseudomonadota bacterium]
TYLARTSNISKYTEGRFAPKWQLAGEAIALEGPPKPDITPLPLPAPPDAALRTGLILHEDDLSPGFVLDAGITPVATAVVSSRAALSPLEVAPQVRDFADRAASDTVTRFADRLGHVTTVALDADGLSAWAQSNGLEQVVAPYAPVGPAADVLAGLRSAPGAPPLRQVQRAYDAAAWPHATHGFFRFKDKIPKLLGQMRGLAAVATD